MPDCESRLKGLDIFFTFEQKDAFRNVIDE